jgi:hypothetical protein
MGLDLATRTHTHTKPTKKPMGYPYPCYTLKLARMMVSYAEITEENGLIVALDQERAYDKVAHDYLCA